MKTQRLATKRPLLMRAAPLGFQPQGAQVALQLCTTFSDQSSVGFAKTVICPSLVTSRWPSGKKAQLCGRPSALVQRGISQFTGSLLSLEKTSALEQGN